MINFAKMTKSTKKWIIWSPICLVALIIFYFGISIIVAYVTDYKPLMVEKLVVDAQGAEKSIPTQETEFSILSWNIGYCGLGKDEDFFYDGGKSVQPSSEKYQIYLNKIFNVLDKLNYLDFIFMQEVDIRSKRSQYANQIDLFKQALPKMSYAYGLNYDVKYIPIPVLRPMGKVKAGMANWSRYLPYEASRNGFDVNFDWLKRIFMLDRCFIVTKHKLSNGKELVMINVHNSAFDDENVLKPIELNTLKSFMMEEYRKGNYVVAGGDWNQNPPGYSATSIHKQWNPVSIPHPISETLFPSEWKWAFDNTIPSERFNDKPFVKGINKTTTIDFFLVSPNVNVVSIETINLDFNYSDHQPILMTFSISADSSNVDSLETVE